MRIQKTVPAWLCKSARSKKKKWSSDIPLRCKSGSINIFPLSYFLPVSFHLCLKYPQLLTFFRLDIDCGSSASPLPSPSLYHGIFPGGCWTHLFSFPSRFPLNVGTSIRARLIINFMFFSMSFSSTRYNVAEFSEFSTCHELAALFYRVAGTN